MTYFVYVKGGGTASGTGGFHSSKKTGSWGTAFSNTNQYYTSIISALSAIHYSGSPYTSNLFWIMVSNQHIEPLNSSWYQPYAPANHRLIGVLDTDVGNPYKAINSDFTPKNNALAITMPSGYFAPYPNFYFYGVSIVWGTSSPPLYLHYWQDSAYHTVHTFQFEYCSIICGCPNTGGTAPQIRTYTYGRLRFKNCYLNMNAGLYFSDQILGPGGHYEFINCKFVGASSTDRVFVTGSTVSFESCDFTELHRPITNTENQAPMSFSNCKFNVSGNGSFANNLAGLKNTPGATVFTSSLIGTILSDSSSVPYQYKVCAAYVISSDTSVYRSSGAIDQFGSSFSYKVVTPAASTYNQSTPRHFKVHRIKLSEVYCDTTSTTTFKFCVALPTGATSLKSNELCIELIHPDDTTFKGNFLTSREALSFSGLGSTLPTDSTSTWNGISSPVKQYISITTTNTGREGFAGVYLYISRMDCTFYIDPEPDIT